MTNINNLRLTMMKTANKIKTGTVVFAFIFSFLNALSQAPPVTSIGSAIVEHGTFRVPVLVSGFTNVADISMKLSYDTSKIIYNGVIPNPAISTPALFTSPVTDQSGIFRLSFTSASAVILGSGQDTLLKLEFIIKPGTTQGTTTLVWSKKQGDCDMTPPAPGEFVPVINQANLTTYFIDGSIVIPFLPSISGSAFACIGGSVMIYRTSPGMKNYSWSVSSGGVITSGLGTEAISVTWSTFGNNLVSLSYFNPQFTRIEGPSNYRVKVSPTCKSLNVKLFVEGFYLPDGSMRKSQGELGDYYGGSVTDKITIELHDSSNYPVVKFRDEGVDLNTSGSATSNIPTDVTGWYYLVVNHRNCLFVISAQPITLDIQPLYYDFAISDTQAFGKNLKNLAPGVFGLYSGDTNNDGVIDAIDLIAIENDVILFSIGYLNSDLNGDGAVDAFDLILSENNATLFKAVITP